MLLTISTTHQPATDLGFLLMKNPARAHSFDMAFGKAHIVFPETSDQRCTAALLLDVDPVGLVRGRGESASGPLEQYVNDRPYVASSFLSVAIASVLGSALNGRSRERQELADTALPLEAHLPVVPARGGEDLLRRLFEPLGYQVKIEHHPLDPRFPEWGASRYYAVTLAATCRLSDLLTHLYVLIPALDAEKHYYVGTAEVEKLLQRGAGWLAAHPERELIAARYLRRSHLVRSALARLIAEETPLEEAESVLEAEEASEATEPRISLHSQRLQAVATVLKECAAKRVLDLGCGEGRLIKLLLEDKQFEHILGIDVSYRTLEIAQQRLRLERMPTRQQERVTLAQGSLMYRDTRLAGYDAAAVVEVIEHLDPPRLAAFEQVVFAHARPTNVVVTTPNVEYNVRFETLASGAMRHRDHRFEWTRAEFQAWAERVAAEHGYSVRFAPLGAEDAEVGAPSQMAVFSRQ